MRATVKGECVCVRCRFGQIYIKLLAVCRKMRNVFKNYHSSVALYIFSFVLSTHHINVAFQQLSLHHTQRIRKQKSLLYDDDAT